jgi:hypothetical protein
MRWIFSNLPGGDEEYVQDIGEKARRKETTRKSKT